MKRLLKINAALVSLLAFCVVCFGQAGASTPSSSPPNAPQTAPEMQSLEKALVGKWSTTYEFAAGGMSPTGRCRHGRRGSGESGPAGTF